MLANATRLCEAKFGTLFRYDGEKMHRLAGVGTPRSLTSFSANVDRSCRPKAVTCLSPCARTAGHVRRRGRIPQARGSSIYGGARSTLYVPLLKDDRVVGMFVIYRQEVRPFTDKHIELVQNFAAQAVIAMRMRACSTSFADR